MSERRNRPAITGKTTVTLFDQVKAFYWSAPWLWWALAVCFFVVALVVGQRRYRWRYGVQRCLSSAGLLVLLWAAIIGFSYFRLSREQKQVRYRVTTERIEISDGTGAARRHSLDRIKRCVETRSACSCGCGHPGCAAAETRFRRCHRGLRGLTAQCLGSKAKLRRSE